MLSSPILTKLPARDTALAWVNAFLASSDEESRPILYRTLSIEFYRNLHRPGVQFIGCNGHALFRTWVPEGENHGWPALGEAPDETLLVKDAEGFGKGFIKTLLALTNHESYAGESLTIETESAEDDFAPSLGGDLEERRLALSACGQRIELKLWEEKFPDWRALSLGIPNSERVEGLTIAPYILGLLGKLKGATQIDLEFNGEERRVDFHARGFHETRGILMPMRRPDKPETEEEK